MFNLNSESFLTELDADERETLRRVNQARQEYLEALVKFHQMREQVLANPSIEAEKSLRDYSKTVIAPLRRDMSADVGKLLEKSVDVDGLKSMLPMILLAVSRSVNLSLLMETLNLDSDMIEDTVTKLKDYIRSDD